MSNASDALNNGTLRAALTRAGVSNLHVEVFDALPSTSEYLSQTSKEHSAASELKPQLCATDWQTNGNGRRGKTWVTPRGNLTFSLLLTIDKPPSQLMGLSLITGICVAESLESLAGVKPNLKWPNDVLVEDKKLCGLLTELHRGTKSSTRVVVGIGINYTPPLETGAGNFQAVSLPMLNDTPPTRVDLISDVTRRVFDAFEQFQTSGWSAFADRWDTFDYLKGRQVRIVTGDTEEHAVAIGVDEQGALLVESGGVMRAVLGGDVSLRLA